MHGSKLNQEATYSFSQSYSAKIVEEFFSKNESITGQQIVSVTPIKQVNFFVLKALFDEWQEEIKKFKSPYFNYKNEDVNQSLKAFVNTLSKNIYIDKVHFQPLLEKAVVATLTILYDPNTYYTEELNKNNSGDKARELKSNSKYIKIGRALFENLLSRLEEGSDLNAALHGAISNHTISSEELDEITALFNRTYELNVLEKEITAEELPMPEPLDNISPDINKTNDSGSASEDMQSEFSPIEDEDEFSENINEQYKGDIKTLNQQYEEKERAQTVAATLETKSLSNLINNININQRYMFVNDLFDGNENDYELALDEVEACDSFDSSVELLVQSYARKYAWDMNADEVKELLKVIFKRFR